MARHQAGHQGPWARKALPYAPPPPQLPEDSSGPLLPLCHSPSSIWSEEATSSGQAHLEPGSSFLIYTCSNWDPVSLLKDLPSLLPGLEGLMSRSTSHDGSYFQGLHVGPRTDREGTV